MATAGPFQNELNVLFDWSKSNGLEIVMVVTGSILLARFIKFVSSRSEARLSAAAAIQTTDDLVRSERSKYVHAMVQAVGWGFTSLVYFVALVMVVLRLGIPITSLVAPATVVGVGLGFGAQKLVQDLLAGFFVFAERQYGVGDVIRMSAPGTLTGVSGTVEELTLRMTKIRTLTGELIFVPNGAVGQVANLSKDWSQVVLDVQVPIESDKSTAIELMKSICLEFGEDENWKQFLLGAPVVTGIEAILIGYFQLRVLVRTLPARQWEVARELRLRLLEGLDNANLLAGSDKSPIVQQVI
ncbi:MAG: mechanosensitive ion channel family protein [Acidimicrobiaceae bacterium]|nr:mechanosensitive ion channel family protein [Acidimicrobiaceae bacterium]